MRRLEASIIKQVKEAFLDGFGLDWSQYRAAVRTHYESHFYEVTLTHKESHKTITVEDIEVEDGLVVAARRGATMLT